MGHVHPETMRELEQELTEARQGILECQTRILALERELAEAKKYLALYEASDRLVENQPALVALFKDRDEAHAAIRALDEVIVPGLIAPSGVRLCACPPSDPTQRNCWYCKIRAVLLEHAPVIRRAMGQS